MAISHQQHHAQAGYGGRGVLPREGSQGEEGQGPARVAGLQQPQRGYQESGAQGHHVEVGQHRAFQPGRQQPRQPERYRRQVAAGQPASQPGRRGKAPAATTTAWSHNSSRGSGHSQYSGASNSNAGST